jgi:hypothetical protein
MEGQELAWVNPKDIDNYNLLPADISFFASLRELI